MNEVIKSSLPADCLCAKVIRSPIIHRTIIDTNILHTAWAICCSNVLCVRLCAAKEAKQLKHIIVHVMVG